MSLAITAYVREGIVMAADSRLTLDQHQGQQQQVGPTQVHIQASHLAVGMSDTSRKLFVTPDNVGIATCGTADIQGVPIAGFIDSFINSLSPPQTPQQIAEGILGFFRGMQPVPKYGISGCGLQSGDAGNLACWSCTKHFDPSWAKSTRMTWDGETDVIVRLLNPVGVLTSPGNWQPLQNYEIPFRFFTIQDAIDCCVYLMKATMKTLYITFEG